MKEGRGRKHPREEGRKEGQKRERRRGGEGRETIGHLMVLNKHLAASSHRRQVDSHNEEMLTCCQAPSPSRASASWCNYVITRKLS
eukprot:180454-Hanusia_phi.AAC.1